MVECAVHARVCRRIRMASRNVISTWIKKKTRRKLSSERRWERSLLYLKQRKAKFYVFLDLLINSLISVNKYKYHNLIRIHQDAQEEGYYMRPLEKGFWLVAEAFPLTLTSGYYLGQYICDDLTFSTRIFEWSQEKVRATRKPGTWTTSQSVSISISLPPVCCVTTRTSMASQPSNVS